MGTNFSLFGWPLPEPREKAGRPEHEPTDENRCKVRLLLALKYTNADIAKALGLSQPTLRKHYLQELSQRRVARLQLDAVRFATLYAKMLEGDVGANKELGKIVEKHDLAELAARVANRKGAPGAAADDEDKAAEKLGKKEQQKRAAGEVRGKFAPPSAPADPRLIN